nr:hypothetical protein [Tanacetum cinerariifolium]
MQQPLPNNNYIPRPSFNQSYMQQPMINPEDISDPTTAMNMALVLMAKAFKNVGNQNGYNVVQNVKNQVVQNAVWNLSVQNVKNQNRLIVVLKIDNQNANQNGNGNILVARVEEETAKDKGLAGKVSSSTKKNGRIVAITAKDMHKRKNDIKARTTLLLALPDEHQLRFSKYDSSKKLWKEILKTFGGNEATKNTEESVEAAICGKTEVPTIQGAFIASAQVPTISTDIDDDDIEEMDIKWNLALLSMRADKFWKKTGKKITIQGSDVSSFEKSKVECFNCHKMCHFARECRSPMSQDRGKRESYKKDPKVEEPAPKATIAIDG